MKYTLRYYRHGVPGDTEADTVQTLLERAAYDIEENQARPEHITETEGGRVVKTHEDILNWWYDQFHRSQDD